METQNLVISFDYGWFLAKNLAYAECPIMKFHYWNSSIESFHYIFIELGLGTLENKETRAIWFEEKKKKNDVNNQQVLEAKGGEKFPFEWGGGMCGGA